MRRSRLVHVIAAAAALLGVLISAPAGASSGYGAAQARSASPFDSTSVFCTRQAAPSGARNTSNPGVTRDAIVLSDTSIDSEALRRIGQDQLNFHEAFNVFVNEINKCGGINGRRLILKKALYNPTAPDLNGHLQALCLKVTEDHKALVAIGVGTPRMERCVAVNHRTMILANNGATASDFIDSKGRVFSRYAAADAIAAGFIADSHARNELKGRKLGLISALSTATAAGDTREQYVEGLKDKGYELEQSEVLPCTGSGTGAVCTPGIPAAVSRLKAKGVNTLVLAHLVPTASIGTLFRELRNQNFRPEIVGPDYGSIHSDSQLGAVLRSAGADGMEWANRIGWYSTGMITIRNAWRIGQAKETPFAKMCTATLAKATGQRQYQYTNADLSNGRWDGTTTVCTYVREVARAIWSLGTNVTTDRLVAAIKAQKQTDRWDTGPDFTPSLWFADRNIRGSKASTFQLSYPCPLPTRTNIACMLPVDRPARLRTINY